MDITFNDQGKTLPEILGVPPSRGAEMLAEVQQTIQAMRVRFEETGEIPKLEFSDIFNIVMNTAKNDAERVVASTIFGKFVDSTLNRGNPLTQLLSQLVRQ